MEREDFELIINVLSEENILRFGKIVNDNTKEYKLLPYQREFIDDLVSTLECEYVSDIPRRNRDLIFYYISLKMIQKGKLFIAIALFYETFPKFVSMETISNIGNNVLNKIFLDLLAYYIKNNYYESNNILIQ